MHYNFLFLKYIEYGHEIMMASLLIGYIVVANTGAGGKG